MLRFGKKDCSGCLMLDNINDIDGDTIVKIVKPYLGGNPEGIINLGNIDIMKVMVQRMIVSLMDKYPRSEWWCEISNKKYLHPTLLRRSDVGGDSAVTRQASLPL